jgi:predicted GNAT family N-acyltransferase
MMSEANVGSTLSKGSLAEWNEFEHLPSGLGFGRVDEHWIDEASVLLHSRITEDAASLETFRAVQKQNPDSFWGLFEQTDGRHRLIGFHAQLMLNEAGHKALQDRTINLKNPPLSLLCRSGDTPAGVHVWAIVAEKKLDIFRPMLARALARYAGIPHYATLATEAGRKAGRYGGMRPLTPEDDRIGGLHVFKVGYSHKGLAPMPPNVRVVAVTTTEQLEQVRAIRAIVFMGEQKCPYSEEFDGNDHCATHVLGFVGDEPAGCARIRYFGDFAKIERLSVLAQYRRSALKYELVQFVEDLVRRKGFSLLYGHPQKRILKFWTKLGFEEVPRNTAFHFSDHDYTEMRKSLKPHADAFTMHADPMVLIRPEGSWDRPGVLDRSAQRPVTRPC